MTGRAPDSLSPTSLESQTLVATAEIVSSTSTDTNISTQKRGPRGEYSNNNILKDPSERKLIHIIGPSEYLEACAAISITKDFKAHFHGTQTQWSHLDDEFVDLLYQCFLDRYQYEEIVDPKEARKVWVRRAMERCRGTWARVRIKCEKKSGSKNKADWKNFCPEFVNVAADWDGKSSYVRHTGGSKSFRTHTHQWANESGKRPSNLELFEKLCKKNRHEGDRCDARSEKVALAPIIIANVLDLALDLHLEA
uniref:GRAS protein n=1 Tax=Tanacetum cinerariifolium TaxID=118510 RepID=A0A6L2MUN0_TANCI|nr:GRAS protein [Tanacetum cinerariifolium]